MELIAKIRQAGFMVALDGEKIRFEYAGHGEPPDTAKALLDALRESKGEAVAYLKGALPRPLFGPDGDIVIPFLSDSCYHWWAGGQSVKDTVKEVRTWKHH